jgi:sirohydrochlorin cobaltochelatase
MKQGLLLFAHGARDPRWALPFEEVARRIRGRAPELTVELCFLEFIAPPLAEGGARLAAAGCTRVDVVPLFLGAGGHVRKDLPDLLDELARQYPATTWQLRPAIGEVNAVIEAMSLAALAFVQEG